MSVAKFQQQISAGIAPKDVSNAVRALWLEARGEWDAAHRAVQDDGSADAAWVHAYLHRKEGDSGNAGYWYRRAGRPVVGTDVDLASEWQAIARALVK